MFAKLVERHLVPWGFSGIDMRHFQSMVRYHNISLNFLTISVSEKHLSKSNTERTSHLELPNIANMSFINGYAKLFLVILVFKCLKSVTTFLS